MILVDLSQVMISNLMMSLTKNEEPDEDMIRHMVLNSLRSYNVKFKNTYGEMVICCDGFSFWRKKWFPYYKANRKKDRDKSVLDWKMIFTYLNNIRDEIQKFLPYRVVRVDDAEGDDVIAILASEWSTELINNNNRILIVSGDKDFGQLQRYPNVEQYDPVNKRKIEVKDPDAQLKEMILRGDVGDGVPNFLSKDDCLVMGVRQKPIQAAKVKDWLKQEPEDFCDEEMLRNYRRNEMLIDLRMVPEPIKKAVLSEFDRESGKNRQQMMKYFVEKRLKTLLDVISDF
jgi:5'-3' exonuclease